MRIIFALVRLLSAVAIVAAVVAQLEQSVQTPVFSVFNFFGYFTIQSNLLIAVVFVLVGVRGLGGRGASLGLTVAHGAAVTYLATTGLVYNTLLTEASLGNAATVPWSNDVLHKVIPVIAVAQWLFFGDRVRIPWRRLWVFLVYPIVWLVVVLLRGASFVPYPFLDVDRLGAGVVALYCVGIAVFIALMSAVVIWLSRYRLLRPEGRPATV